MRKMVLAAAALTLSGATMAQIVTSPPKLNPAGEPIIPLRRQAAPVPALLQTRAHEIFTTACVACHGNSLDAGPKAPSLFTKILSGRPSPTQPIVQAIAGGPVRVA